MVTASIALSNRVNRSDIPRVLVSIDYFNEEDWNDFPYVAPPEDVWMRVETATGFGYKARFHNVEWRLPNNWFVCNVLFRP